MAREDYAAAESSEPVSATKDRRPIRPESSMR